MIWSFTALTQAERCMHAFRAKYITKTLPFVPSPAADYGVQVHKLMERHVKTGAPFPPDFGWLQEFVPAKTRGQSHFAEMPLAIRADGSGCSFWDKDCWFRGKADFVSLTPSSGGEPAVAVILDWKTGKPWDDPDELEVFAALAQSAMQDQWLWYGAYVWLKERRCGGMHELDPAEKLDALRARISAIDLESDKCSKTKLCDWCGLKGACPATKK